MKNKIIVFIQFKFFSFIIKTFLNKLNSNLVWYLTPAIYILSIQIIILLGLIYYGNYLDREDIFKVTEIQTNNVLDSERKKIFLFLEDL